MSNYSRNNLILANLLRGSRYISRNNALSYIAYEHTSAQRQ